jgi:hypothetical protein
VTATYTFDVFSSLDGFGTHRDASWGGYWSKQGPWMTGRLVYAEAFWHHDCVGLRDPAA